MFVPWLRVCQKTWIRNTMHSSWSDWRIPGFSRGPGAASSLSCTRHHLMPTSFGLYIRYCYLLEGNSGKVKFVAQNPDIPQKSRMGDIGREWQTHPIASKKALKNFFDSSERHCFQIDSVLLKCILIIILQWCM